VITIGSGNWIVDNLNSALETWNDKLAEAVVSHGIELMTALFQVAQGMVSTIMAASGLTAVSATALPSEMVTTIEGVGLLDSIPLWAITLLG